MTTRVLCSCIVGIVMAVSVAQAQKALYLEEITKAAEQGWRDAPAVIERWKNSAKTNPLWGYDPPAHPIYLAATLGFLYERTGQNIYAERAASLLADYGSLRQVLPKEFAHSRAEYAKGIPALTNFFFLPPYARAYMLIRSCPTITAAQHATIERDLGESVDFVFSFPEWGAHNRAMLRVEALTYGVQALPTHPRAASWHQMAEVIAKDNLGHWEVEDASNYHPVWLHALFSYATAAGHEEVFSSVMVRYYLEYFTKLIGPSGTIPDFGDAQWNSSASGMRMVAFFEKGAATFRNAEWKWAAASMHLAARGKDGNIGIGDAYHLADAWRWCDETITPTSPSSLSQEVLDDVIGKKVVFRNGWQPTSTYLLLNYRDEGDGGFLDRTYLRNTISVEEEKMHHGHADENSVVLLMDKGSVLLHDAGYRSGLPSGPLGAWRQDYFHNRMVVRSGKRDVSQSPLSYVQNAGAYRVVRTSKVDFRSFRDADMSRTRVTDAGTGYQWDRVIVYVRDPGYFVVIDGVQAQRPEYFTMVNFWHARDILRHGDHFYDIATDSVPGYAFPKERSLLVLFPETRAKLDSVEPISRHSQTEHAVYQTITSQYATGEYETFVTILYPHDRTVAPENIIPRFRVLPTSSPSRAVAVVSIAGKDTTWMYVRLDMDMELARENIRPRQLYERGKVSFGDFSTDGYFFFAGRHGNVINYSCANFLKLEYAGKTVVGALPNTHGLQLDGSPDRVGFSKWRSWEGEITAGSGAN